MKKVLVYIYYGLFLFFLFIVGLLSGDYKVNAETLTSWTTQQGRIQTTHDGSDTWSSWSNISGDSSLVFDSTTLTYPVKAIAYHLKTSNGLSRNNEYSFRINYKPTPDSLHLQNYSFENSTTGQTENVTCTQTQASSGFYWLSCSFSPQTDYSSSDYLYVKLSFYQSYQTELRMGVRGYETLLGTNAVITEQSENIINNQNNNTQEIINNINQANENLLNGLNEQQQICNRYDKSNIVIDNKYLDTNGNIQNNTSWGITDYIKIDINTKIKVLTSFNNSGAKYCFYNINKEKISCHNISSSLVNTYIEIPNNSEYFRSSISKVENKPTFEICKNGNQAIQDTLTDDSVDNPNSSISDMESLLPSNGVITQLIGLPITLYQKVLNSINGTCSQFDLGELYGTHLIMPCINLNSYLGNTLWNTIDLIISGIFVLTIARKMIKAFESFTGMKEGDVIND